MNEAAVMCHVFSTSEPHFDVFKPLFEMGLTPDTVDTITYLVMLQCACCFL